MFLKVLVYEFWDLETRLRKLSIENSLPTRNRDPFPHIPNAMIMGKLVEDKTKLDRSLQYHEVTL